MHRCFSCFDPKSDWNFHRAIEGLKKSLIVACLGVVREDGEEIMYVYLFFWLILSLSISLIALNYWSILLIHGFQIIPSRQSNWIAFSSTFTYWSILLLFSLLLSWVPNNTSLQIKRNCLCLHVERLAHDPVGRCGRSPSSGYDDKYVQLDVIQPWD